MSGARAWAATFEPYTSRTYVNVVADEGVHLNQNIRPAETTAG